ncbi:MAG: DUF1049 domain-containing protein [Acidimicrobiia bacterium]
MEREAELPGQGGPEGDEDGVRTTRTATALVSVAVGMVVVILMLIFVVQNSERVRYEFLWTGFTIGAGVGLLLAALAGGLVVSLLGLGRVMQLRLAARRHRDAAHGISRSP